MPEPPALRYARESVATCTETVAKRREQLETGSYPMDSGDRDADRASTADWLRRDEAELVEARKRLRFAESGAVSPAE